MIRLCPECGVRHSKDFDGICPKKFEEIKLEERENQYWEDDVE